MSDEAPSQAPLVDWSTVGKYQRPEIGCKCGAVYRSFHKNLYDRNPVISVCKTPCPRCGETVNNAWRVSYDVEEESVDLAQVGKI